MRTATVTVTLWPVALFFPDTDDSTFAVTGKAFHLNPMRVLYVVPGQRLYESMRFAYDEIARVEAAGAVVRVVNFPTGFNPVASLRSGLRLRREAKAFRPDLVHAHFGSLTALTTALFSPVPVVVTFRGSDLNPAPSDGWLKSSVRRFGSQLSTLRARRIICVSLQLQGRLWWAKRKATVIPSGVDLARFRPVPVSEARKYLGWDATQPVVLFNAGRDPGGKRLDLAEEAVNIARKELPGLRLEAMRGNVPHERVPLLMAGSNCLLVTSDYEGSPDIVKEALACNLPVVSVRAGDVPERLEGVSHSYVVERDARAISAALVRVMRAGERSNGRSHVAALDADEVAAKIVAVYQALCAGNASGSEA